MTEAGKSTADKPAQAHSNRKACAGSALALLATAAVFLLVGRYVVPSNSQSEGAPQLPGGPADGSSEQGTSPRTTDSSAACGTSSPGGGDAFVQLESVHREVDTYLLVEAIVDQTLEEHVRFLAREPHVAGSPREEQELAQYVADRLTEYGFDEVQLQPYHVLLTYANASDPNTVQLLNATTGEVVLEAAFQEKTVDGVDTDIGPAFLAYSPPGDVLGCLVYVNRATHEDLDDVEALNVSVTGCICLARYGGTTLASKAYTCARKGAVGLLVFPDSSEQSDGTESTSTLGLFPSGLEMPGTVIRRDTMMQVGDPLTPGVPAIPSAERMDPAFAGLPPIPSQPISYRDAQVLLRLLEGPVAPEHFGPTGNVTYRLGEAASDRLVRLRVNNVFTLAQINNVIATLRGSAEPDRYVVVGAQRDSFGFGALHSAPNTASLLAIGQALGSLKKRGVRPRRSVLLCSWAAGEYGQVGSTEWVEQHLFELHPRAVAYVDISECTSGGRLVPKACPSVENLAVEAASRVRDPANANRTLYDVWREQAKVANKTNLLVRPEFMDAMSDSVPFSLYAGVPSISFLLKPEKKRKKSGEATYAAYHTAYDTLRLYNWTDARLAPLCARLHGAALWLAADSLLIPVNFSASAVRLKESLEELRESPFAMELELNGVSLDALRLAIEHFQRAADQWTEHLTHLNETSAGKLRALNDRMSAAEQALLKPTGLPGRPLTRHLLWAPSEFDRRRVTGFPVFADLLFYISQLPLNTRDHGWKNLRFYLADVLVALRASAAALRVASP
ncbi:aminopeptidase NAALADL1 [Rhipicephalus microplus]|uniref:aminopeptidase NAALADL1 n=1 Tax=Rhipicephalus microplus TaxID=6941 RepID=UPI003F6CFF48